MIFKNISVLTNNQKEALDFKQHLSVTANAGAGKTFVLVRRFVEILLNTDARVNELVAITFTEKAAGELRKKIADHIEEKIHSTSASQELLKLERIRDQLISANIGTIHSFCAQLLREYPVEANIDAGFTILEEIDKQILEYDAMRETFLSVLSISEQTQQRDAVTDVIRMLGKDTVQRYLSVFLEKREQIERMLQSEGCLDVALSDDQILEGWNRSIIKVVSDQLDNPSWLKSLNKIFQIAKGKTSGEVSALFKKWSENRSIEGKIDFYVELTNCIFTQKGTLRKEFIGSKTDTTKIEHDIEFTSKHYLSFSILSTSIHDDKESKGNRILLRSLRVLLDVFRHVVCKYEEKKLEYGQLDFEDILLKTRELLLKVEIRNSISKRFKYIMVDEFQDTNRLQHEILQLLVSNFKIGNLFIVGDPKQSIYGFRDAEVEIFNHAKNQIVTTESGKEIVLAESFRLLPNLIDFVDRVFAHIMMQPNSRYDVPYNKLVQGRRSRAEGAIELLLVPSEDAAVDREGNKEVNGATNAVVNECIMIAQRILDFTQSNHIIYQGKSDIPKQLEFKDIAILLRRRTHLAVLEKTLMDFKIPYVLTGGVGFYQTQEVYDLLNYFKFLLNPEDDVSLAGILRSPFFTLSDVELFDISLCNGNLFWHKFKDYEQKANVSKNVHQAVCILSEHLELANRIPIPSLIRKILLQTGWAGSVAGLPYGEQNVANIEKFLRDAREFENKGYTTLYDFVKRIEMLVEQEEREGQASLDVIGNCVQVMTIHAAKGLEFPVVFVPFAHQKFRYDNPPYIETERGIGYHIKDDVDLNESMTPPLLYFLQHESRQKTEAEEKRIFYVACTRARDILIISGKMNLSSNHTSYLKWISEELMLDDSNLKNGKIALPPATIHVLSTEVGEKPILEIPHRLTLDIRIWDGKPLVIPMMKTISRKISLPREIYIQKIQSESHGEYFSATQIKTFLECPAKYYLKYILGLPEKNIVPVDFNEIDDSDDVIHGEIEGQLTHSVLQTIDKVGFSEDNIKTRIIDVIKRSGYSNIDNRNKIEMIISRNVFKFLKSQFGAEVLSTTETKTELTITASFGGDYFTGTIDRLYKNKKNNWGIVDYKTERIDFDDIESKSEVYKIQLLFYAFLVNNLYKQKNIDASLIFLRLPSNPVHFKFSEKDMSNFQGQLQDIIKKIKTGCFEQKFLSCKNCTYQQNWRCVFS